MSLYLDNRYIPPAITLLDTIPLSGAASRARTRLMSALAPHMSALQEAEYALVTEYAALNPDGTPQVGDEGQITFSNPESTEAFQREHHVLLSERAKIEETYGGQFHTLTQALTSCPQEFTGVEAVVYDALLSALEKTGQAQTTGMVGGEARGSIDQTR